jgi:SNF2 family DNA or RNA helicase
MGDEQKSAYKDMMNKLKIEFNGGEVTAVNEAVKAMKLVQIACGVAYGQDGEHIIFPAEERIKAVKEIVEQAEGKVIVYVPLTGGLQRIAAELADAGYKTAIVHGETPKRERDTIFSAFQDEHNPLRILIAHPQCMSHGLTLTSASVIIWYIPTNNFAVYEQACGRIVRQGQTRSQHIIHLEGSPVEQRLYTRLEQRGTSQGILLDLIKQEQEV